MAVTEMPLAIFTFLMQLSIGAFIAVEAVRVMGAKRSGSDKTDATLNKVVYAAFILAIVGLLASFFHLKVPIHAPFALVNFATSWMTREIWFAVIFIVLLFVYCVMLLRRLGSSTVRLGVAVVIAVVGLVLVFCMANAYMNPAHPAWNMSGTVLSFYATTFLVGPSFAAAAISLLAAADAKKASGNSALFGSLQSGSLVFSAAAGMVALAVISISLTLGICGLSASGDYASLASVACLVGEDNVLFVTRMVLVFAGVLCAGISLYCNLKKASEQPYVDAWAITACVLLVVAEFIGRNLFYAAAVQIGI